VGNPGVREGALELPLQLDDVDFHPQVTIEKIESSFDIQRFQHLLFDEVAVAETESSKVQKSFRISHFTQELGDFCRHFAAELLLQTQQPREIESELCIVVCRRRSTTGENANVHTTIGFIRNNLEK